MTYLVNDIVLPLDFVAGEAFSQAGKRLRAAGIIPPSDIRYSLYRRSVDARKKDDVRFVVSVLCEGALPTLSEEQLKKHRIAIRKEAKIEIGMPDRSLLASLRIAILCFFNCSSDRIGSAPSQRTETTKRTLSFLRASTERR